MSEGLVSDDDLGLRTQGRRRASVRAPIAEVSKKESVQASKKGEEVPKPVLIWLKRAERAVSPIPPESVAVIWSLASTNEGRPRLVELGAHMHIMHLLALLLVPPATSRLWGFEMRAKINR